MRHLPRKDRPAFRVIGLDGSLGRTQERLKASNCLICGFKKYLKGYKRNGSIVDKFIEYFEYTNKIK